MNIVSLLLLIGWVASGLLTSTPTHKLRPIFQRGVGPRRLMPLGVKEIESIVDATAEEQIHNGLTSDEIMESTGTQHKMETLLDLINQFHRKMGEVDTEMNDGVSRLNSYIGLTRKFK